MKLNILKIHNVIIITQRPTIQDLIKGIDTKFENCLETSFITA